MNVTVRSNFDVEMHRKNAKSPFMIITCRTCKFNHKRMKAYLTCHIPIVSPQTITNTLCANIMATLFDVAKIIDEPSNAGMHTIE